MIHGQADFPTNEIWDMRYVQADIRTCDSLRNGLTDLLTYEKGDSEKPGKKTWLMENSETGSWDVDSWELRLIYMTLHKQTYEKWKATFGHMTNDIRRTDTWLMRSWQLTYEKHTFDLWETWNGLVKDSKWTYEKLTNEIMKNPEMKLWKTQDMTYEKP